MLHGKWCSTLRSFAVERSAPWRGTQTTGDERGGLHWKCDVAELSSLSENRLCAIETLRSVKLRASGKQ